MPTRIISKIVIFERSFVIEGFNETLSAGSYQVDTEERLIQGLSFQTYLTVLTTIHLHSRSGNLTQSRAMTIDPNDLEVALMRDSKSPALLVRLY